MLIPESKMAITSSETIAYSYGEVRIKYSIAYGLGFFISQGARAGRSSPDLLNAQNYSHKLNREIKELEKLIKQIL